MKREEQSVHPKMKGTNNKSQKQSAAKQSKTEERTNQMQSNEASVAAELKNRMK